MSTPTESLESVKDIWEGAPAWRGGKAPSMFSLVRLLLGAVVALSDRLDKLEHLEVDDEGR